MEVKIGVQHAPREIVFESNDRPEDLEAALNEGISSERRMVSLNDSRGGRILVPADRIAYVEIGPGTERRVGFGAM